MSSQGKPFVSYYSLFLWIDIVETNSSYQTIIFMQKKRLLFISSRPIFPITGGDQIRTAQQLELLCEHFDVDVLYITPNNEDSEVKNYAPSVINTFRFHINRLQHYFHTMRFVFNRLPLQVNYYFDNHVSKKIDSILTDYDCVFCNNIRTAEYVREKKGLIKYLDFVDAISMNYDKARREAKGLKKLIYEIDYRRCKYYEQKCLDSFDSCAVISDVDNQYIISCQE